MITSTFLTNALLKFVAVALDIVLVHLMVPLFLGKVEGLLKVPCQLKKFFKKFLGAVEKSVQTVLINTCSAHCSTFKGR